MDPVLRRDGARPMAGDDSIDRAMPSATTESRSRACTVRSVCAARLNRSKDERMLLDFSFPTRDPKRVASGAIAKREGWPCGLVDPGLLCTDP